MYRMSEIFILIDYNFFIFYPSCRVVHLARRRSCRVELLENYERDFTISGASMNLTAPTPKPFWS